MDISKFHQRALEIRQKYKELEIKKYGKEWTKEQLVEGFKMDVSDLCKLIQTNSINKQKISHELSDCFWSVLVLAEKYQIDIQQVFFQAMNELEAKIEKELQVVRK